MKKRVRKPVEHFIVFHFSGLENLMTVRKKSWMKETVGELRKWLNTRYAVPISLCGLYFDPKHDLPIPKVRKTSLRDLIKDPKRPKGADSKILTLYVRRDVEVGTVPIYTPETNNLQRAYVDFLYQYKEECEESLYKDKSYELLNDPVLMKRVFAMIRNCERYFPSGCGLNRIDNVNITSMFLSVDDGAREVLVGLVEDWQRDLLKGELPESFKSSFASLTRREEVNDPILSMEYISEGLSIFQEYIMMLIWHDVLAEFNRNSKDEITKLTPGTHNEKDKVKLLHLKMRKGGGIRKFGGTKRRLSNSSQSRLMAFLFDLPERNERDEIVTFRAGEVIDRWIEKLFRVFTRDETLIYTKMFLDEPHNHIDRINDGCDIECKCCGITTNPNQSRKEYTSHKDKNSCMRQLIEIESIFKTFTDCSKSYPAGGNAEMGILRKEKYGKNLGYTNHVLFDRGGQGIVNLMGNHENDKVSASSACHQIKTFASQHGSVQRGISVFNRAVGKVRTHVEQAIKDAGNENKFIKNGLGQYSHVPDRFNRIFKFNLAMVNVPKIFLKLYYLGLFGSDFVSRLRETIDSYKFVQNSVDVFLTKSVKEDTQKTSIAEFKISRNVVREKQIRLMYEIKGIEKLKPYLKIPYEKEVMTSTPMSPRKPKPKIIFDPSIPAQKKGKETKLLFQEPGVDDFVYGFSKSDRTKVVFYGKVKIVHTTLRYDETNYPKPKKGEYALEILKIYNRRIRTKDGKLCWPIHLLKLPSVYKEELNKQKADKLKKKNDFRLANPNSPMLTRKRGHRFDEQKQIHVFQNFEDRREKSQFLNQFGLELREVTVIGNGSCQYSSVAHEIYTSIEPNVVMKLRRDISDWMRKNEYFVNVRTEHYVWLQNFKTEEKLSFTEYIEGIEKGTVWGDHVTLQVCCELFDLEIYVVESSNGSICVIDPITKISTANTKPIYLLQERSRGGEGHHYDPAYVVDNVRFEKFRKIRINQFGKDKVGKDKGKPNPKVPIKPNLEGVETEYTNNPKPEVDNHASNDLMNSPKTPMKKKKEDIRFQTPMLNLPTVDRVVLRENLLTITESMMKKIQNGSNVDELVYDFIIDRLGGKHPDCKLFRTGMVKFILDKPERALTRVSNLDFWMRKIGFARLTNGHAWGYFFDNCYEGKTYGLYGWDSLGISRRVEGSKIANWLFLKMKLMHPSRKKPIKYFDLKVPSQGATRHCVFYSKSIMDQLCTNGIPDDNDISEIYVDGKIQRALVYDAIMQRAAELKMEKSREKKKYREDIDTIEISDSPANENDKSEEDDDPDLLNKDLFGDELPPMKDLPKNLEDDEEEGEDEDDEDEVEDFLLQDADFKLVEMKLDDVSDEGDETEPEDNTPKDNDPKMSKEIQNPNSVVKQSTEILKPIENNPKRSNEIQKPVEYASGRFHFGEEVTCLNKTNDKPKFDGRVEKYPDLKTVRVTISKVLLKNVGGFYSKKIIVGRSIDWPFVRVKRKASMVPNMKDSESKRRKI